MYRYVAMASKNGHREVYPASWPEFATCTTPRAYFAPLIHACEALPQRVLPSLAPDFVCRHVSGIEEIPLGRFLVLFRHGVSEYNDVSSFTGWHDPPLAPVGCIQAAAGWALLAQLQMPIRAIFESPQKRAMMTTDVAMSAGVVATVSQSPFLLERHYGDKQGQSVNALESAYTLEDFVKMRWSYAHRPGNVENPGESLQDVELRLRPYLQAKVLPALTSSVCIVGQGNGMRTLCKILEGLTPEAVENLECLSSEIILYRFSEDATQILDKYILKNPAVPDPMCLSPQDYKAQREAQVFKGTTSH